MCLRDLIGEASEAVQQLGLENAIISRILAITAASQVRIGFGVPIVT